jgi:hypothetical protein
MPGKSGETVSQCEGIKRANRADRMNRTARNLAKRARRSRWTRAGKPQVGYVRFVLGRYKPGQPTQDRQREPLTCGNAHIHKAHTTCSHGVTQGDTSLPFT